MPELSPLAISHCLRIVISHVYYIHYKISTRMKAPTKREQQVAAQWGANLITFTEVQRRLKKQPSAAYIRLALALKHIHYQKDNE